MLQTIFFPVSRGIQGVKIFSQFEFRCRNHGMQRVSLLKHLTQQQRQTPATFIASLLTYLFYYCTQDLRHRHHSTDTLRANHVQQLQKPLTLTVNVPINKNHQSLNQSINQSINQGCVYSTGTETHTKMLAAISRQPSRRRRSV